MADKQTAQQFDCLIIGGGLVGASLGCALRGQALKVGIVEAQAIGGSSSASYDDRGLAIAPASQRILAGIDCWQPLRNEATPIKQIHVSDRGHFGATRISAEQLGIDQLGHIVIGRALGKVLQDTLQQAENTEMISPANVIAVEQNTDQIHVQIKQADQIRTISCKLLIAADGGQSQVRQMLGVNSQHKDYRQTAIVTNVSPEFDHKNTAYERFTNDGPLALLPSSQQRCVLVWSQPTEQAQQLLEMDEPAFLQQLGKAFGYRLGRFIKMGQRRSHPMHLVKAEQLTGSRFAILGNAAHTIHPNAAQGLNLGLRDIAQMAELIIDATRAKQDIGSVQLLEKYARLRQRDQQQVIRFSDGLSQLFYNDNPFLISARNLAMLAVDLMPPAKRALARRAMGLAGQPPRLVRGLPL